MLLAILLLPLAGALLSLLVRSNGLRPWLVPTTALAHLTLTLAWRLGLGAHGSGGSLALDALGYFFLLLMSALFSLSALYLPAYLRARSDRDNRVFCTSLLFMLAMLSLVAMAQHLGLLWVAIETSTLSAAPLIYFNKNPRSIEATWKYLMIGSVGIALALLGSLFLGYAAHLGVEHTSLEFGALLADAPKFSHPWLRAAFVVLLVGYGTKMGLAPLHTWKIDAYGEAPGVVGGVMAGAVTSAAFLALLRIYRVVDAGGQGAFARGCLVAMGLLSMAWAAVFLVRQTDFKRMLAYSSVEHMGILVLGVGLGGTGVAASILHVANNGLSKTILFLAAGNIHRAFGSKTTDEIPGAVRHVPTSAALFILGFLAVTGSPPFGPFVSMFGVANAALGSGRWLVGASFLTLLLIVFVGMGTTVLDVVYRAGPERRVRLRDSLGTTLAPLLALAVLLCLGVWRPPAFDLLLSQAAHSVEAAP